MLVGVGLPGSQRLSSWHPDFLIKISSLWLLLGLVGGTLPVTMAFQGSASPVPLLPAPGPTWMMAF